MKRNLSPAMRWERANARLKKARRELQCAEREAMLAKKDLLLEMDDIAGIALSSREREVLLRVRRNLQNKEIASELNITASTVKWHVGRILRKAGATCRVELLGVTNETQSDALYPIPVREPSSTRAA